MSFLAAQQLAAWEAIADGWEWCPTDGGRVARCLDCDIGIALIRDEQGKPFRYTDEQWLALVVLHLRTHHEDLDPNG